MQYFYWFFVLGSLFIKTTLSQFPTHIDLQKVGQIQFQGETYNVLKPTVHEVSDHFKEFMLRRDTRPDERVFIDDDGFRHHWKGFGLRENLRKSDKDIENIVQHTQVDRENSNDDPEFLNDEEQGLPGDASVYLRQKPAATKKKAVARNKKAAVKIKKTAATTKKTAAATTTKAIAATTEAAATTKADATTKASQKSLKSIKIQDAVRTGTRTAAKTYFFCPFFGVITMQGFID